MTQNHILYQENVEMPNKEIGINIFYYDCINSLATGIFPLHWHRHLEMIAVKTGWLEIEIERNTYKVQTGSIAVVNPSQLHACYRFDPSTTLYCLMADMDIFRSRFVESSEEQYISPLMDGQILFAPVIDESAGINQLIQSCYEIFTQRPEAYQLRVKAILFEMLYQMFSQYVQTRNVKPKLHPHSLSRERVNIILQYVEDHYAERIQLDDLVEIVHINKYYICKIFQQYVGKTFLEYVNLVRVQKAIALITSTNASMTDIAFSTGFQDINYFSRMFKRVMGISPTDLRKRQRKAYEGSDKSNEPILP